MLAGGTGDQNIGQAGTLAANLATLMEAVAALRQAQALVAQAAAARSAAEQLHAALTAARARVTHPSPTPEVGGREGYFLFDPGLIRRPDGLSGRGHAGVHGRRRVDRGDRGLVADRPPVW